MKKENLHPIYNSLDFKQHDFLYKLQNENICLAMRKELGIYRSEKVIIAVGRLTRDKRIDLLVDMISMMRDFGSNIPRVLIVGDGPEYSHLERKIAENNLGDNFILYGACYDEIKLSTMIFLADVAVAPGDLGLFGMHALAFGTPVVTHDNFDTQKPEFEAIQDGRNGSFYAHGNIDDLREKVSQWLNYAGSVEVLREACREIIVNRYNADTQAQLITQAVLR